MMPWKSDSVRNMPITVRRVVPTARSMPISRRRSAMTVRNEFAMMNPAVTRANTPNMVKPKEATCKEASSEDSEERPPTW